MSSMRARLAVTLLSFAFALLATTRARATTCYEAISEATAKSVFDGLVKLQPGDACALDDVHTEQSELRITWKKQGRALEPILVVPTSCVTAPKTHGKLSALVPPGTASACPAAADGTESLVTELGVRELVTVHEGTSTPPVIGQTPSHRGLHRRWAAVGLAALVSCVLAFFGIRRWRQRRALARPVTRETPEPIEADAARGRPRWQRNPARAGWGVTVILAPHLVLGTWLFIVPDHVAFTAAEIVTLVHVGLALLGFPLAIVWTYVHVRRMRTTKPLRLASSSTTMLLGGAVVLAMGTGALVLFGGDIARVAPLHAIAGFAVGIPLAVHLSGSPQKWPAAAVASALVVTTLGGLAARRWLPETSAEATIPAFTFTTRDASLYEPAANCGECHQEDYADWKRSTHARTLELPNVQESLSHAKDILGETLTHIGELRNDPTPPPTAAVTFSACGACHAPTTFYGNDKGSMLAPTGVVAEGVGCSFCHTLRAVHESPPSTENAKELSSGDVFSVMSRVPLFVSSPETVRRYLFQGSHNPIAHRISNWLVRWRPDVHARDYDASVLRDSRACLACHSLGIDSPSLPHMTYFGWKESSFVTHDRATTVECQDCHMTRHMTGSPTHDPGRMVPWGPMRPRTRSHLMVGGNVRAAETLGDQDLAREDHAFNAEALTLTVTRVERDADALSVTARVHSNLVGHYFPALETQLRYGWVELQAVDAAGHVVASTPAPKDSQDFGCASPFIMASTDDPKPDNQRLVAPRSSREFTGRVTVPGGAEVDTLVAVLHESVDPTPIARATWPLHAR